MNKKNVVLALSMFLSLVVVSALQEGSFVKVQAIEPSYKGETTIHILNVEDYIYLAEEEGDEDLVVQFEKYAKENLGFENPHVVYATTPTPETMLNELETGKANYDLLCPSDYMIQRMVEANLLDKLDGSLLPSYNQYASVRIREYLDNCFTKYYEPGEIIKDNPYAVGYMWGTLGILFNPTYQGRNYDQTCKDMQTWDVLWNSDYRRTISVKDSMRDTFAVGLIHSYTDDYEMVKDDVKTMPGFKRLHDEYKAIKNPTEEQSKEYNDKVSNLFNMDDSVVTSKESVISNVSRELNSLKTNIYGLEVDTGKNDILTNKIGVNLAWSGDAVYSMDLGEEENNLELCYSVPEYGSNIWFDGWCMPKRQNRTEAERQLAHAFLDFISMPENASQNMDYTGYTPFIAGDDILDLTRSYYDCRYDEELEDIVPLTAEDLANNVYQTVDLTYFFDGTLDNYGPEDMIFYTTQDEEHDLYLPYKDEGNISVGRQFYCQFPDEETIVRCAVMRDFGKYNNHITKMWEKFKSTSLPVWAIVLFSVEGIVAASLILYFVINKMHKKSLRKKRKGNLINK